MSSEAYRNQTGYLPPLIEKIRRLPVNLLEVTKHSFVYETFLGHLQEVLPNSRCSTNMAMKLPSHQFDETVAFYRDTLGLSMLKEVPEICGFQFGAVELWLDRVPAMSQAELWLQLETPDVDAAATYLAGADVVRCDEIEPLPENYDGLWISSPANIIHLVSKSGT